MLSVFLPIVHVHSRGESWSLQTFDRLLEFCQSFQLVFTGSAAGSGGSRALSVATIEAMDVFKATRVLVAFL